MRSSPSENILGGTHGRRGVSRYDNLTTKSPRNHSKCPARLASSSSRLNRESQLLLSTPHRLRALLEDIRALVFSHLASAAERSTFSKLLSGIWLSCACIDSCIATWSLSHGSNNRPRLNRRAESTLSNEHRLRTSTRLVFSTLSVASVASAVMRGNGALGRRDPQSSIDRRCLRQPDDLLIDLVPV